MDNSHIEGNVGLYF